MSVATKSDTETAKRAYDNEFDTAAEFDPVQAEENSCLVTCFYTCDITNV